MNIGAIKLDKNQLNALVFGFLVLLLPVAVYLASNVSQDYRTKAAPIAHLALVAKDQTGAIIPENPNQTYTINQGEQITVDVMLTTGANQQIELAMMNINYPANVLTINYDTNPTSVDNGIATHLTSDAYCGVNQNPFDANNFLGDAWLTAVLVNNSTSVPIGTVKANCAAGALSANFTPLRPAPANAVTKIATLTFTVTQTTTSDVIQFDLSNVGLRSGSVYLAELGCIQADQACGNESSCNGDQACINTIKTCKETVVQCENNLDASQTSGITVTTDVYVPPTATPTPPPAATNTPTPQPQGQGASLILSTPLTTVNTGESFDVEIRVDSDGQYIAGADAVVDFDPSVFQVAPNGVVPNTASTVFVTFEQPTGWIDYFDNVNGRVDISGLINTGSQTGELATNELLAMVTFNPVSNAATSNILFYFDQFNTRNDSNVAAYGTEEDILQVRNDLTMTVVTTGPTSTPVPPTNTPVPPTSTPVPPTNTPVPQDRSISIIIDMQGRNWRTGILNRILNLYVFQNNVEIPGMRVFEDITNVTDPSTGQLQNAFTLTVGETYDLVIQPKGYLNQVSNQAVTANTSVVDMRSTPFKAGDINSSGKVNIQDYNQILSRFKVNTSDIIGQNPDEITDLDGSGQINSLDFSLLLSNWNQCGAYEDTNSDGVLDTKIDSGNPC